MQVGVSDTMVSLIRESLKSQAEGLIPIQDMGDHYVARKKTDAPGYRYLFTVDVDGTDAHVYFQL